MEVDIDIIYNVVDDCFRNGKFSFVDDILEKATAEPIDQALALLISSHPAKFKLLNYQPYLERFKQHLMETHDINEVDLILQGL